MTTGDRIKKLRKEQGISAERLAESLGVSRATMFRYENGEIEKLPGTILEPLAKALHTTPAYLMGWEDEEQISPYTEPQISDKELKFALFGGGEITDDVLQEVKNFAQYVKEREKKKEED